MNAKKEKQDCLENGDRATEQNENNADECRTGVALGAAEMDRPGDGEGQQVGLNRAGNTKHLDLQLASEKVDRSPIGEWSRSDHRPISIARRGRPRQLIEFQAPPVAPLWEWFPTKSEVQWLAGRWASWASTCAADIQRELTEAAARLIAWPAIDAQAGERPGGGAPGGRNRPQQQAMSTEHGERQRGILGRAIWREKRRMRTARTQRRGDVRGGRGGGEGSGGRYSLSSGRA